MNSLINFAMGMLSKNPQIANNPNAQEMISVIQSGDFQRGQQIAQNLCQSNGVTPEQAIRQAMGFFHI